MLIVCAPWPPPRRPTTAPRLALTVRPVSCSRRCQDPDCSRRDPDAAGHRPASVTTPTPPALHLYGRTFTAEEVQLWTQTAQTAAEAPVLAAEIHLLQVLIARLIVSPPGRTRHRRRRRAGGAVQRRQHGKLRDTLAAVSHAVDVLQRALKTQHALTPAAKSTLFQLLDEAAPYIQDQPAPYDPP